MSTYYSTDYVARYRMERQRQAGTYSNRATDEDHKTHQHNNDHDTFESPNAKLVAPDESARIWGDPHVEEADGGKYDFHEQGIFNLLEDGDVTLNARLDGKDDGPTYVKEAGLIVNGRKINIDDDGTVMIHDGENGKDVKLKDGETRQLGDGSYITKKGDIVTVSTPEYKMEFKTNQLHEGNRYMDITVSSKDGGVMLDGTKPTGLLGETFDKGSSQQTKPKDDADEYERDSLYETKQKKTDTSEKPKHDQDADNDHDSADEPSCNCPNNTGDTNTNTGTGNNNGYNNYYGNGTPYSNTGYSGSNYSQMAALINQIIQMMQQWMRYFTGGVSA